MRTLIIASVLAGAYALGALHLPQMTRHDQTACGEKKKDDDKKKDDKKSIQFT